MQVRVRQSYIISGNTDVTQVCEGGREKRGEERKKRKGEKRERKMRNRRKRKRCIREREMTDACELKPPLPVWTETVSMP